MLVLSRKLNETIRIGDDICVTVSEIKKGRVRLAIDAPSNVNVRRTEIIPEGVHSYGKATAAR
jgi:carbon storage regulator